MGEWKRVKTYFVIGVDQTWELDTFSDLSPLEENQLYVCDKYFADDEAEQSFVVGGKEITAKLLAEALHSLPEEKRETVLLYYFFDMSEREIAKFCNLSLKQQARCIFCCYRQKLCNMQ